VRIAQTSCRDASTTISPAILLELGDVRSIRTATSSHSSPEVDVSDSPGVPPNHQTILREVDDVDEDDLELAEEYIYWVGLKPNLIPVGKCERDGGLKAFTPNPYNKRHAHEYFAIRFVRFDCE
jgi:hypothetical protein